MLAMPPANLIFMWEKSSSLSPNKLMGRSCGPANTRMIVLGRKPCKFRASVRLNQSHIYINIYICIYTFLLNWTPLYPFCTAVVLGCEYINTERVQRFVVSHPF